MNAKELKQHIVDTYGLLEKQVVAHVPEEGEDGDEGFDYYGLEFTDCSGIDVCWVEWREKYKEYQVTVQGGWQNSEDMQIMQIAQKVIESDVLK
jgi:hypothetical protein